MLRVYCESDIPLFVLKIEYEIWRFEDMKKVKITVLHKEFYPDYADTYLTDGKQLADVRYWRLVMNLFMKEVQKCRKDFAHGHGLIFIAA